MYPISDLTAFCRRTTGDVPPKLVGASTTVIGSKMYLYGGRLVSERRMVSDIYMFDLESFHWERLPQSQSPEDDMPQARYFHSADTWCNHLIIFGGMAIKPQSDNPEDLCVLNDVRLFDLTTGHWLPSSATSGESSPPSFVPNARYAHLSSVSADRLFIIGGQDLANVWLDDVYIYDLVKKAWVQRREYSRHCGTYRSVAVTTNMRVRLPQEEMRTGQTMPSNLGPAGARFKSNMNGTPTSPVTSSESLVHLPYSAPPTDDFPCDIFLFSNYNFTDVQRELEVFSPLSDGDFTVSDRSVAMTGTSFPPGLRFPTGAILGTFFIVAGTYLSQTYQSFSIWALDLINMSWSRIDPGSALATGSWFRSCLWPAANRFVVFGNRHGNLVEDYNRRLLSWEHVTCIDLEAFGIYQPPPLVLDIPSQELGLAAFEEGTLADFEIICDDGRKIRCSRKLLEERWPWFKEQRKLFVQAAQRETEAMEPIPQHVPLPELPGAYDGQEPRPDPRLTPRSFSLSEPYPITLALVQYFYSMALITPLQHAPAVLSQLLLLSSTYELVHLQSLVKHAMHRALSYATSVGIYGVSTLCSCRSLQIRALRVVMAYSQKRPGGGRSRADRDGPSSSRNGDANGNGSGGSGGNGSSDTTAAARPRGLSDASYLRGPSDGNGASQIGYRNASSSKGLIIPIKCSFQLTQSV
ncbi:galactose oxidase [Daedalea quercina L-15889]|uniref:Galactose oxidase n=1 Tax=Daedalea quercina L-15889 TaxID=1314783 RepID=A0A165TQ36_9APHY|nr:galactose oxidase [Daedalea quercina L-15889]